MKAKNIFLYFLLGFLILTSLIRAQWKPTNGPSCGSLVNSFLIKGSNIFAGVEDAGDYKGIFLSTDNGESWKSVNTGLTNVSIRCFASNDSCIFAGIFGEIFKSTDDGNSWSSVSEGLRINFPISSLIVVDSILLAGSNENSIFRSTNNGDSWVRVDSGSTNTVVTSFVVNGSTFLAARDGGGLLRSTDYGISWQQPDSVPANFTNCLLVKEGTVFAGTSAGLFSSTNNGTSWSRSDSGLTAQTFSLAVIDSNILAGTVDGVFISTNNGKSWEDLNSELPSLPYVYALAVLDSNIFAATSNGVFLSTNDGLNWNPLNLRTRKTTVYSFADIGSNLYAATSNAGIFYSDNGGENWIAASTGLSSYVTFSLAAKDTDLYTGTLNGVFRSSNGGRSWTEFNSGLWGYVQAFEVNGSDLYAGALGVYVSRNEEEWIKIDSGSVHLSDVNALAIHGQYLFASTSAGIYRSVINGKKWIEVDSGITDKWVNSLEVDNNNIYAGTNTGGIFVSMDDGLSWNSLGLKKGNHSIIANNDTIYTGTDHGVFTSTDGGINWITANQGISYFSIHALSVQGNVLFAGAAGSGVWSRPISELLTTVEKKDAEIPFDFHLEQNYPNPFNPSTIIGYQVPIAGLVTIKVYDVLGNEIAILVDDEKPAGNFKIEFNGSNLSSGVYFYRIQAGNYTQTKKFILMK